MKVMMESKLQNGMLIEDLFENPAKTELNKDDFERTSDSEHFSEEEKETDPKQKQLANEVDYQPSKELLDDFMKNICKEIY